METLIARKYWVIFLSIAASMLLLLGCDDEGNPPDDITNLSGVWQLSKLIINGAEHHGNDISAYRVTMNGNGTYSRTITAGDSDQGSWTYNPATKILSINPSSGSAEQYEVLEASNTLLKLAMVVIPLKQDKVTSIEMHFMSAQ